MSSTTTKSDYIQPSSILPYDSKQSPLELLAQTCSSIGKDSSSIFTSQLTKSFSTKRLSPIPIKRSSKESHTQQIDSTPSLTNLFPQSSFTYLTSQYSYPSFCTVPGCFQCHTSQYLCNNSFNNLQFYVCHYLKCGARFFSEYELYNHIRSDHKPTKMSSHSRFQPYLKPSKLINTNDQLPYFYPYLSLSSTDSITKKKN
ncbi:unnamed protein product [Adineta ricciae]|uniref:C2H2-type domain-containing protein n=1 Tax=Adineta ricciae TaxID=249248 RepID=A0A815BPP1_ADIRI|nr:unnamed protein product [Adineta ricciae]CAF1587788.1 unnamed protein product [Adineta ricciae]